MKRPRTILTGLMVVVLTAMPGAQALVAVVSMAAITAMEQAASDAAVDAANTQKAQHFQQAVDKVVADLKRVRQRNDLTPQEIQKLIEGTAFIQGLATSLRDAIDRGEKPGAVAAGFAPLLKKFREDMVALNASISADVPPATASHVVVEAANTSNEGTRIVFFVNRVRVEPAAPGTQLIAVTPVGQQLQIRALARTPLREYCKNIRAKGNVQLTASNSDYVAAWVPQTTGGGVAAEGGIWMVTEKYAWQTPASVTPFSSGANQGAGQLDGDMIMWTLDDLGTIDMTNVAQKKLATIKVDATIEWLRKPSGQTPTERASATLTIYYQK